MLKAINQIKERKDEKISSAIFLMTLLVFINCKNNPEKVSDETDSESKLYQSLINLGNGFLDVFTSFGGLVADAFGFKASPKKSDAKEYFNSLAKTLEETKKNLDNLSKDNGSTAKKTAAGGEDAIGSAVEKFSGWLTEMLKAVKETAEKTGTANEEIGKVETAGTADAGSVNGIAKGMKGIVEAAKKGGVELKAAAGAGGGAGNADAGKIFAGQADGDQAAAADAGKAADAVSKVSGEQILSAIIKDAGGGDIPGAAANAAENPIAAAIGGANMAAGKIFAGQTGGNNEAAAADAGKAADAVSKVSGEQILSAIIKDASGGIEGAAAGAARNPIAAAIVLRGMATDGKFAAQGGGGNNGVKETAEKTGAADDEIGKVETAGTADKGSVNGIAKGMKGIVEAAKKGGVELQAAAAAAGGANNVDAGKIFAGRAAGNEAAAEDAGKAAAAVSKVSGEQILSAIIKDASGDIAGAAANAARNPIAAAIGGTQHHGAAFGANMNTDDKIAAAIVLRGMATNGKFAAQDGGGGNGVKETIKSAVENFSEWLTEMLKAVKETAEKTGTANEEIGKVDNAGGTADKGSVNGIAKGMKGIVEAAKKGGVELKVAAAAGGGANMAAGKIFAGQAAASQAAAADAGKAADAVSKVSGEQILSAIIKDASGGDIPGAAASAARNPIAAAIGGAQHNGAAFGENMNTDDKIAAAIVLRGMATDGKFAADAVSKVSGEQILSAIIKDASGGDIPGAAAGAARNPIAAAIGGTHDGAAFGGNMNTDDKIAAAIVLRGMATNGKFAANGGGGGGVKETIKSAVEKFSEWLTEILKAVKETAEKTGAANEEIGKVATAGTADKGSVNGIAKGMKGIVEAAKKGGVELQAAAAGGGAGAANTDAGKIFAGTAAGNQAAAEDAGKAAAAIVLRGMATNGKFAAQDGGNNGVKETAEKTGTANEEIGKVDTAGTADKGSVNGIAKGMKGIVEAAKKGGVELKVAAAAGDGDNMAAGKIFAGRAGGGNEAAAADAGKTADAVSKVSGEQILSAIIKDASGGDIPGAAANNAGNPIAAAIGGTHQGAVFGANMNTNDKIAAAIVLRGMATNGKFAAQGGGGNNGVKETIKSAVLRSLVGG
ncbi:variable large family protein [Borreliella burgdorferi]|uniref:variable large family protein n=1 Tax=Borreliella burgdorferi TaxID=139 RepID=UPI00346550BE